MIIVDAAELFHDQRVKQALSLLDLEKRTGIPKATISQYERGKRPIEPYHMLRINIALSPQRSELVHRGLHYRIGEIPLESGGKGIGAIYYAITLPLEQDGTVNVEKAKGTYVRTWKSENGGPSELILEPEAGDEIMRRMFHSNTRSIRVKEIEKNGKMVWVLDPRTVN